MIKRYKIYKMLKTIHHIKNYQGYPWKFSSFALGLMEQIAKQ